MCKTHCRQDFPLNVFCSIIDWLQACSHPTNERPQRPVSTRGFDEPQKPLSATSCEGAVDDSKTMQT